MTFGIQKLIQFWFNFSYISTSMMYSLSELTTIVNVDSHVDPNRLKYSVDILPTVLDCYDEIHTDFQIQPNLLSNSARFRLGQLAPSTDLDYQPNVLEDHPALIMFLVSILHHFFQNTVTTVNFSPLVRDWG